MCQKSFCDFCGYKKLNRLNISESFTKRIEFFLYCLHLYGILDLE